jgi:hypothetical protein
MWTMLVTLAALGATAQADVQAGGADAPSQPGVFSCPQRAAHLHGTSDERIKNTGWRIVAFDTTCSWFFGLSKELLTERFDPDQDLRISFGCWAHQTHWEVSVFGPEGFPTGSHVTIKLRIGSNELVAAGTAHRLLITSIGFDPGEWTKLIERSGEAPDLEVELSGNSHRFHGTVRLNDWRAALTVLEEKCPNQPPLPSRSPGHPQRLTGEGLVGDPHAELRWRAVRHLIAPRAARRLAELKTGQHPDRWP